MREMTLFVVMVVVVAMRAVLDDEALRSVKRQIQEPETIQSGNEYPDQHQRVGVAGTPAVRFLNGLDDRILRKESGEARHAGQRERSDPHRDVGNWHVAAQATH